MLRLLRVVPLTLVCLVWAEHGLAETDTALDPEVEATSLPPDPVLPACPGTVDLEDRLRNLLEASSCGVPERQLLVTLRQADLVSGTLVVLHDYQAEFVREVSGPSCAEVEAALTLALEIYLDPGETGDTACVPKGAARPAPTSSSWPGQDLDPFNLPQAEVAPPPTVIEPQARGLVRAVVHIDSSYSPNVAFGVGATVRLRVTPQNFASITLSQQVAPPFPAADGTTVRVSASALAVSFGQHLPIGRNGEFSIEVGPRAGVLETGIATSESWELTGTVGIELTASLGLRVARGFWAGIEGGGVFNVLRARYLDEFSLLAWEQPWTGGYFGLYFSAAVPAEPRRPGPSPGPPRPQ